MSAMYQSQPYKQGLGPWGWVDGIELISNTSTKAVARYFGGLRYAQPPTGHLRFRRTRPLPSDFSYGTVTAPGATSAGCRICPQPDWPGVLPPGDVSTWSEDCLQANIWMPAETPPSGGWPILFFIHGGFLQFGNANKPIDIIPRMYEETTFKAIVVMPAYRVNLFGFLASHELQSEASAEGECAGNMGFWDQRTALEWTVSIAPWLGGNAENITVAGYSAGTSCICSRA